MKDVYGLDVGYLDLISRGEGDISLSNLRHCMRYISWRHNRMLFLHCEKNTFDISQCENNWLWRYHLILEIKHAFSCLLQNNPSVSKSFYWGFSTSNNISTSERLSCNNHENKYFEFVYALVFYFKQHFSTSEGYSATNTKMPTLFLYFFILDRTHACALYHTSTTPYITLLNHTFLEHFSIFHTVHLKNFPLGCKRHQLM